MDKLHHAFSHGHDYIQIGDTKWATMNVGAKSVTDVGLYFLWGETCGHNGKELTTRSIGENKFKVNNIWTKYNHDDNLQRLEPKDDPAHVNWRGGWRMPTIKEIVELRLLTEQKYTVNYKGTGVKGLVVKNGTHELFFPSSGYIATNWMPSEPNIGCYWLADHNNPVDQVSDYMFFAEYGYSLFTGNVIRGIGMPVRGVLGP